MSEPCFECHAPSHERPCRCDLKAEIASLTANRDEWRNDFRALEKAIVGDTGLSAMTIAAQARLYRPRAKKADEALAAMVAKNKNLVDAMENVIIATDCTWTRDKLQSALTANEKLMGEKG